MHFAKVCLLCCAFPFLWFDSSHACSCSCGVFGFSLLFWLSCFSSLFLASACFSWVLPAFSLLLLAWHAFTLSYSNCSCFYGFLVYPCLIVVFAALSQVCLVFHSFCGFVVCLLFFAFPFLWFDSSHACSCCVFCFSLLFWLSCFSSLFLASACFSWVLPAFSLLLLAWHTFTLSYSNCSCSYGFHVYPCLIVVFAAFLRLVWYFIPSAALFAYFSLLFLSFGLIPLMLLLVFAPFCPLFFPLFFYLAAFPSLLSLALACNALPSLHFFVFALHAFTFFIF